MTETEIIAFVSGLGGVAAMTASAESGAPEVAWGDSFFYYDPDGDAVNQRSMFATLVVSDYPGFDTESRLDRDGVFRLNVAVGRPAYERLLGHSPATHEEHHAEYDYTELDVLLPHPIYAGQGWVSILNPGPRTAELAQRLLAEAHDLARSRWRRRQGRG
jgi:Family of unknown function (DUF6194)